MPLTGPSPANSRYALSANATRTRAESPRKNPFTTGNPYTGTFRSQRVARARSTVADAVVIVALVVVVALIVAPSIRFLSHARVLLLHDPSGSCGLPAPGRRTAEQAVRSTDRSVSASAACAPEPTPAQVPVDRVSRRAPSTDIEPACRRCRSRHRPDSGSSGRDYS